MSKTKRAKQKEATNAKNKQTKKKKQTKQKKRKKMIIALRKKRFEQKQALIREVATLARSGENTRAPASARNAPLVPVTEQIVQEIKNLYPTDPEPPAPAQALVSNLFLSEVAELISTTLRSEPGPHGMRAEHWYDFGSLAGHSDLFVQVVAHTAAAAVYHAVPQYLTKPTGGHRQLLVMPFLRRLARKSVMAAKKESVAKCAGPSQHGVATRWIKHDDQNHSIPRGSWSLSSRCCS